MNPNPREHLSNPIPNPENPPIIEQPDAVVVPAPQPEKAIQEKAKASAEPIKAQPEVAAPILAHEEQLPAPNATGRDRSEALEEKMDKDIHDVASASALSDFVTSLQEPNER